MKMDLQQTVHVHCSVHYHFLGTQNILEEESPLIWPNNGFYQLDSPLDCFRWCLDGFLVKFCTKRSELHWSGTDMHSRVIMS